MSHEMSPCDVRQEYNFGVAIRKLEEILTLSESILASQVAINGLGWLALQHIKMLIEGSI